MKLYVLYQDVTTAFKNARAMCFDADVFNPFTFTEEAEREISEIDGFLLNTLKSFFKPYRVL